MVESVKISNRKAFFSFDLSFAYECCFAGVKASFVVVFVDICQQPESISENKHQEFRLGSFLKVIMFGGQVVVYPS